MENKIVILSNPEVGAITVLRNNSQIDEEEQLMMLTAHISNFIESIMRSEGGSRFAAITAVSRAVAMAVGDNPD